MDNLLDPSLLFNGKLDDDIKQEVNYKDFLIDLSKPVVAPLPILSVKEEHGTVPILNEGNISMIQGKAKSRKSTLIKAICQAIINGENAKLISHYTKKHIAILDTEQSEYWSHKACMMIKYLTGVEISYLKMIGTSRDTKMEVAEQFLKDNKDCGLIFFDNITHFVKDFNDPVEANDITQWEQKIASEYNTHICNVLHENSSGDSTKAKGHLGTFLTQVCDTIIGIEMDKYDRSQSIVKPRAMRGMEFKEFGLTMDLQGVPHLFDVPTEKEVSKNFKL